MTGKLPIRLEHVGRPEMKNVILGPKLFDTVITKSVRLEESPAYKESIFTFAPQSSGAIEYEKLCKEVMSRV